MAAPLLLVLCTAVRRCCKGTRCPRPLCPPRAGCGSGGAHGSGCKGLRVNQGRENPLVPWWDFNSESAEEKEGLLPYPLLALGATGGCCYSFPVQSSSAYLEENQTWKQISLSPFQRLSATEGFGPSEVSMSAGSTEGQEGNSALPDQEVLAGGLGWPLQGLGTGWVVPWLRGWAELCWGGWHRAPGQPCCTAGAKGGTLSLLSGCSLSDTSRVTSETQPGFAGGANCQQLPLLSA